MSTPKHQDKNLITDSGIIEDSKARKSRLFVFLCNVITVCLVILGVAALTNGLF